MDTFYVGPKKPPQYLVEVYKNERQIRVYTPDRYSKKQQFHDRYALGKKVVDTRYDEIIITKRPSAYKNYKYLPELVVRVGDKYYSVTDKIKQLPVI